MNTEMKTLLLVDDEPANIQIVNSILKDIYKTRIATNGAKALELANQYPAPDLILLDVKMPEMDGYEVCAHLKSAEQTRDIPVIFLTGQTEIDDETRGFEVGAVDYIHKPFSPAVVQARGTHAPCAPRYTRATGEATANHPVRNGHGTSDSIVHLAARDSCNQGFGHRRPLYSYDVGGG